MIEHILSRLEKVQKLRKPGAYLARCPAHEDGRPSLMLSQKPHKVGLHCFAGCTSLEIMQSVGLMEKDLYTDTMDGREKAEYQIKKLRSSYRTVESIIKQYLLIIGTKEWTVEAKAKMADHIAHKNAIVHKARYLKKEYGL